MKKKKLYPGIDEVEQQRRKRPEPEPEPDFIAGSPNYDKFSGWEPLAVLEWLNID